MSLEACRETIFNMILSVSMLENKKKNVSQTPAHKMPFLTLWIALDVSL